MCTATDYEALTEIDMQIFYAMDAGTRETYWRSDAIDAKSFEMLRDCGYDFWLHSGVRAKQLLG